MRPGKERPASSCSGVQGLSSGGFTKKLGLEQSETLAPAAVAGLIDTAITSAAMASILQRDERTAANVSTCNRFVSNHGSIEAEGFFPPDQWLSIVLWRTEERAGQFCISNGGESYAEHRHHSYLLALERSGGLGQKLHPRG